MAPLRSAIISGMNFIFLSFSRPSGRDKLIFTQRPKRIAPFEIECYSLSITIFLVKMAERGGAISNCFSVQNGV